MGLALLEGAALALPAILTPGPYQAFLLSETVRHGARRTFPAAFAPLVTDGLIIALVLTVLTGLPPRAMEFVRLAGGGLLIVIAASFVRHQRRPLGALSEGSVVAGSLLRAVGMNLLNPNPYLFWGVVAGPILLRAWRTDPTHAVAFLAGFYGVFVGGLLGLILAFAGAGGVHPGLRQGLGWVAAVGLAVFGVVQIVAAGRVLMA